MMESVLQQSVSTYLSRLTGETLTPDSPLRLRSVQRAALSSWARQQKVSLRFALISSSMPFTVRELLLPADRDAGQIVVMPTPQQVIDTPVLKGIPANRVGVDIEEVDSLPVAFDYREHAFYQDNFTAAEISYCIRQRSVRASLCGLWAAKEAIVKAGIATAPQGHLKGIEISHDDEGRPVFAGSSLSISHSARSAVAVCNSYG